MYTNYNDNNNKINNNTLTTYKLFRLTSQFSTKKLTIKISNANSNNKGIDNDNNHL